MRIPTLEAPAPDEMFTAWIAHLAKLNHMSANEFYRVYFRLHRESKANIHMNYPVNLEFICLVERESIVFPKLETILKRHTDLYAMLPFMDKRVQIKCVEYILRHPNDRANIAKMKTRISNFKICPMCLKEDFQTYGRTVIHVPHQQPFVYACWKHGVKLISDDSDINMIEQANEAECIIAKFYHDLYENPVWSNFEQTKDIVLNEIKCQGMTVQASYIAAIKDGFVVEKDFRVLRDKFKTEKSDIRFMIMPFVAWLYKSSDLFRTAFSEELYVSLETEKFKILNVSHILSEIQCKKCGTIFHRHVYGNNIGLLCPECAKAMTDEEIEDYYLEKCCDDSYEFTDDTREMVRHKPCGTVTTASLARRFWRQSTCAVCAGFRNITVSDWQERVDPNMKEFRVLNIMRKTKQNPDLEIEHIGYGHTFRACVNTCYDGNVFCRTCAELNKRPGHGMRRRNKVRTNRLGEEKYDKAGNHMKIVRYGKYRDIDVEYDNGVIIRTDYNSFEVGAVHRGLKNK